MNHECREVVISEFSTGPLVSATLIAMRDFPYDARTLSFSSRDRELPRR
jgi:hypothetical protein